VAWDLAAAMVRWWRRCRMRVGGGDARDVFFLFSFFFLFRMAGTHVSGFMILLLSNLDCEMTIQP
jgi:hypothetical protein